MRTTIAIKDQLLDAAKKAARHRGATLGQLVEDALRRELAESTAREGPPVPIFTGDGGLQPGVPYRSNRAMAEFLERSGANAEER
ncbi:MAG: type II toxin-antitoxin system VapB family antitoxin [Actinobacteria bacterium]|jgi:hypothetical protein|nr:type II toxin-antitoxin system VapB family antitoxin [Actinomycetota bacterium]MCL5444469.1 type II toxin-antitoxin system VapB family antitoxin [Actinomycetota bacterium]